MSKIICDVCGTAYPETATQCPICGFAKSADDQAVVEEASGEEVTYVHTKGGRFSKRNVRRRNRKPSQENRSTAVAKSEEGEEGTNVGLIIVVIALLLAIIAVVIYIGIRFFAPADAPAPETKPSISQTEATELRIACTELTISNKKIEFRKPSDAWLVEAKAMPTDTTDKITFTSANENVAIVSEEGRVTAVGGGETVITVKCGDITQECQIICTFGAIEESPEGGDEHETSAPVDPDFEFKFNAPEKYRDEKTGKWDTTITTPNSTWRAYKKDITVHPEDIVWTSDDPAIASIDKSGIVTAVAPGVTEVHAQYGGKTYTCIVRCNWKVEDTEDETGDTDADETAFAFDTPFKDGEKWDTTLAPGKTWRSYKTNAGFDPAKVTWTVDDTNICTVENGVVKTVALGTTELHVDIDGKTYTCIIRVKV